MLSLAQISDVDEVADTFVTEKDLADKEVAEWEAKRLGLSPVHRLSKVGRDAVDFRTERSLAKNLGVVVAEDPLLQEKRDVKSRYFAQIGRNMLEMQLYEEVEVSEPLARPSSCRYQYDIYGLPVCALSSNLCFLFFLLSRTKPRQNG
jgi:hypothetical protein